MKRKCNDRDITQICQLIKSVSKKLSKNLAKLQQYKEGIQKILINITPNSVKTLLGVFFYEKNYFNTFDFAI